MQGDKSVLPVVDVVTRVGLIAPGGFDLSGGVVTGVGDVIVATRVRGVDSAAGGGGVGGGCEASCAVVGVVGFGVVGVVEGVAGIDD